MSVIDLVARCTIESRHTSIPLPICEKYQEDNRQFSQKLEKEICGAKSVADQQCFSKHTFVKTKENTL